MRAPVLGLLIILLVAFVGLGVVGAMDNAPPQQKVAFRVPDQNLPH